MPLAGQDSLEYFSIKNVFFCNSYYPVSKLWLLNDGSALGARRFDNKNGKHIRDIVLIGKDGLVKDSLSLIKKFKTLDYFFQQIEWISVESEDRAYIHSGKTLIPVAIRSQKIILEDTTIYTKRSSVLRNLYNKNPDLLYSYILMHNNLLIGYDREKLVVKNKDAQRSKIQDDHKNFPYYWIVDLSDTNYKKVYINHHESKPITNSLYWDIKDWDQTWSRIDVFSRYVTIHHKQIYFSVPRANKCYVYDIDKKTVSSIPYPAVSKSESCHYYFDPITKREFVVKKSSEFRYLIYVYNDNHSKVYLIKEVNHRPFAIINYKVHLIREEREGRNTFLCHYLVPLKKSDEDDLTILDEISVKQ